MFYFISETSESLLKLSVPWWLRSRSLGCIFCYIYSVTSTISLVARQQFLSPLDKRISRPNSFQLLPKYCILLDQNIFTAIERRDFQTEQFYDVICSRKERMTGPADSHRIIRHNLRLACLTIAARRKSFSVLPNYTSPEFKILAENALECDVRKVF